MKKLKPVLIWLLICIAALIISTFIHECAHGVSCMANGYAVSTGFNRVGNAYCYPGDDDFRTGFTGGEELRDIGPAATLLLAVVFTFIFVRKRYRNTIVDRSIIAMASANAIIRLVPCVTVLPRILISGSGMEDEIGQGAALAAFFGHPWLFYLPLAVSIIISFLCLFIIYRRYRNIRRQEQVIPNPSWIWLAYPIALIILNSLDACLRINWMPLG